MPKYDVTLKVTVTVRVLGVEAASAGEAAGNASKATDFRQLFDKKWPQAGVEYTKVDDGIGLAALVDEEGDDDFARSGWYKTDPWGTFVPDGEDP